MKARSEIIMTRIFLRRYSILSGNDDMKVELQDSKLEGVRWLNVSAWGSQGIKIHSDVNMT